MHGLGWASWPCCFGVPQLPSMAGSGPCHLGDTMPFKLHPYGPHDLSASSPVGVVQVCNHIPKENAEDLGVRDGRLGGGMDAWCPASSPQGLFPWFSQEGAAVLFPAPYTLCSPCCSCPPCLLGSIPSTLLLLFPSSPSHQAKVRKKQAFCLCYYFTKGVNSGWLPSCPTSACS